MLVKVVPPVAGWRDAGIPRAIPDEHVRRILDACDRTDRVGIRNFAILMLVARLGLRSIEVARLELADIDWRSGRIMLRSRAGRDEGLPLPVNVGEALAAYLSLARPETSIRQVFLAVKAPARGIGAGMVADITHRACDVAGLARVGPHRLRHSLATRMLRGGASMVEVSQVLRHRDRATTAIYAKVDFEVLRTVAQPWPEVAQ
ncbi:tyrosine-type recombinase/integrase [Nocardia sp. NPDC059154]|uniref:tyrosine-type recombinase/integrase n=1 Tax=Nocardia sp. NPDC059154 TaxID=3346744 RepID=UPI0036C13439